jgi:hypothetical protein
MIKRFVLLAALTSCAGEESWTLPDEGDLAGAILEARPTDVSPPPPGFQLEINNLTAGDYAELHITGATPGSLLRLVWGRSLGNGPCPAVLGGLCLSVASPVQVASFASIADDDGEAWMAIRIPPTRVAPVAFQVAAFGESAEVSNPVQRQVSLSAGAGDLDNDNDGSTPDGGDCADFDSSIHPSAADTLGDGLDQNCDNMDGVDADADGYASVASGGTDCGDDNGDVWPGALEACNGLDDDCDGVTDPDTAEGAATFYLDGDGDNYGTSAGTVIACEAPVGYGAYTDDCNDSSSAVHPNHAETCNNGVDNDCDGAVDENCGPLVVSFTTVGSTTWTVPAGITTVQVLVVGGGGGGGTGRGGAGGGAGGFVQNANYSVTPGAVINVTVGGGGNGGTTTGGSTSGSASVFGTLTAPGGGAGGNFTGGGALVGATGGSGGGGAGGSSSVGAAGTAGMGFAGGNGSNGAGGCYYGGGGGGANAAGGHAVSGCGGGAGAGGSGKASTISGSSAYYAGGGSGSPVGTNTASLGGGGGGGGSLVNGNSNGIQVNGFPGTANTGGGGGGGGYGYSSATSYVYYPGGAGGSGVVIVRYCTDCTLPSL